jgi:hypothetical protein
MLQHAFRQLRHCKVEVGSLGGHRGTESALLLPRSCLSYIEKILFNDCSNDPN